MWERVWPTKVFAHGDGGKVVPPVSIDLASGTETSEPRAVASVWMSFGLKLVEKKPCL
jgi:hypothetical protein